MLRLLRLLAFLCAVAATDPRQVLRAQNVTFGGTVFVNKGLVGVGRVDADKKDKLGETFGSLSGLALDLRTWRRTASGTYSATLYTQPDRGYVKGGVTTNYRARRHKFALTFKPDTNGSSQQDQIDLSLSETTLLIESGGTPLTSLDPTVTGGATRAGIAPRLPQAFNGRLAIDPEGLALLGDGTFFVSDEYGPYVYRFGADGALLGAVRPPEAFIPKRNGVDSFSSDSPAAGQPAPNPSGPDTGRENSQGFEGLAVSADGRTLYTLVQSALRQDGGAGGNSFRRYTRLLVYNIANPAAPTLTREYILPLPLYTQSGVPQVASVGDLVVLNPNQFLVLTRDGNGRGADVTKAISRAVLLYDVSAATNIAGTSFDAASPAAAPNGVLAFTITPATSAVLIDLTDESQLNDFDLNNNSAANANSNTLAEKWESLALAPALDAATPNDYFLFIGNDNDFSTTDGFQQEGGSYKAGLNIDTMVLAYRLTLPGTHAAPSIITQPSSIATLVGQSSALTVVASGNPTPTFQWSKNGTAIANATDASLTFASLQASDTGSYSVAIANANGSVTSSTVTVTVNGTNAPTFTTRPTSQTVATGTTAVFSAAATNSPSYRWERDGTAIAGATSGMLVIPNATTISAATYTVIASNASGVALSSVTLTVANVTPANAARIINLSILTSLTAGETMTMGTALGGANTAGTKALLVRAAGPSLAQFSVNNILPDPRMSLIPEGASTSLDTNNDWGGSASLSATFAQVGAFPYITAASRDAALYRAAIPIGNYSVQVSETNGAAGNVIAELYDATPTAAFTATTPRLINVSVLKQISATGILTAGFAIGGTVAKTVLVRAIGPRLALAPFNINGAMPDPRVDLIRLDTQALVASNDNWGGDAQLAAASANVGAFAVTDSSSKDAMLLVTLAPGNYTAQAGSANATAGLAIVEVYEVP